MIQSKRLSWLSVLSCLFLLSLISRHYRGSSSTSWTVVDQEYRDYINSEDGDQVQVIRKSQIIQSCVDRAGHGVVTPMSPYFNTKFFPSSLTLAEEEGVGWCRIGKVDSTPWLTLFLLMRGVPVDVIEAAVTSDHDHIAHDLMKKYYPSKPSERLHKIRGEHGREYFTFLMVRHPFHRLISAFRDKLETLTEYNTRYHVTHGVRMTERRVHNSSVADNPTFPEFVDYLIRTPPNIMDKHWAPYTKVELIKH